MHVSAYIADATKQKDNYIRTRAQDNDYYAALIMDYIRQFGGASRDEIDKLLSNKLSDELNQEPKRIKISNILTKMRRTGAISNRGSRKNPEVGIKWPKCRIKLGLLMGSKALRSCFWPSQCRINWKRLLKTSRKTSVID